MKAVRIHSYGGSEVLVYEDAPRPSAGDGEVLIRVHAASINPFDAALRAGYLSAYIDPTFPAILGTDVSGVIEEVGAGVNDLAPGDSAYTRAGISGDGSYAEYVVARASDMVAKPESLDHVHSAAIPHVILTAWQALIEVASLSEGQTVLIHGAAGGVGHVVVQLARLRGARVIGTASANFDFLSELGVDQTINYSTTRFEEVARNVDVVLDTVGGETQERSWSVLKPGGVLISLVQPPSTETAAAHGVRESFISTAPPVGETLTEVAAMVDAGRIKPEVSMVLPIAEIRRAHDLIEGRHTRGKIVLQVAN